MEESTEAHMETDVSSTTEDVPETQEVTGSNGNVEMVIVVEEVKEEEMNSNEQAEEQPVEDSNINEVSKSDEESLPIVIETQESPTKSPIEDIELVPSPSILDVSQKVVNKDVQSDNEVELSAPTLQSEDADSSIKEPLQIDNENTPKPSQSSPMKTPKKSIENSSAKNDVLIPVQISPTKELPQSSTMKTPKKSMENSILKKDVLIPVQMSPTKELPQSSPMKTLKKSIENSIPKKDVLIPVQMSLTKELQLTDSTRSTPTKEPLLVEKFTINGKIESNDPSNDSSCKNISNAMPLELSIERDTSNDSQLETHSIETNMSDISEKEHNKSISRELKSLINSAKESKIINECTQLTSKTRKSRSALDTSLNTSVDADKIHLRRNSNNSQKSNCSEKSEKVAVKRSMRSQNPEFVSKVKQFLNSVTGKGHKESDDEDDAEEKASKDKLGKREEDSLTTPSKMRKVEPIVIDRPGKLRTDSYCWRCHWVVEQATEKVHAPMHCTVCPRSFHYKCLSISERNKINSEKSWVCPECLVVLQAESSETRSQAMKKISLSMLCDLLKHALERMMDLNGVEPFLQPVDRAAFPDYDKYVVHPMDLSLMKSNINDGLYGSTEAFLADAQWILHNSIIFNTLQSKLTAGARALVRSCRAEMGEIEACPECYAAAHARRPTWFTDVCSTPHILLWAKLKGFPYWPAKGMSVNSAGHVDVRFFGAHDRAWVPAKDCFLYSEKDPNNFRTKRQDIIDSMQEAEQHIRNISRKYGKFVYPPFRTQFDPTKLNEQLKMMIPSFEGEVRTQTKDKSNTSPANAKDKSRSNSTKSSYNDGESENEDAQEGDNSTRVTLRKMADGAEIAREEEDSNAEKAEVSMDVDAPSKVESSSQPHSVTEPPTQSTKTNESSRKRRRSELVEAVITIMDNTAIPDTPEPKRKKSDKQENKKKSQEQEPSSSKEKSDKTEPVDKIKNGPSDGSNDDSDGKDNEPTSTRPDPEKEKIQRVTPIRIALVQKDKGHNLRTSTAKEATAKIISPNKDKDKDRDNEKTTPLRQKSSRSAERAEKATEKTAKEEKFTKAEKRRNSRNNRSLTSTPKIEKQRRISLERKPEKTEKETSSSKEKTKESAKENKDKTKENSTKENKDKLKESYKENKEKSKQIASTSKEKETEPEKEKSKKEKPAAASSPKSTSSEPVKSVKDRLQFDDDTTLAVIARESRTVVLPTSETGLPMISCVRTLSTTAQNTGTTITKVTTTTKTPDVSVETSAEVTLTSADNCTNTKDAASKLQKTRNDAEPLVGRVGVRAFARMPSCDKSPSKNDDVQLEIKAEPIDVDDADRHIEKLNLMNAFRLRPVNPPVQASSNLREVRINKVLVTPLNAKKPTKAIEVRPRAKKTFPQPKKPEDGQLNCKNSMVYIPIQPPMTQAPVRPPRVVAGPTCPPAKPINATSTPTNNLVNTVTTPVMHVSSLVSSPPVSSTNTSTSIVNALGQVPAAVHTVPLMTSVNGQWMFSFQPVMSVGAIENSPSPPILNGVSERGAAGPMVPPLNPVGNNTAGQALLALHPPTPKPTDGNAAPGEPPRLQQRPATVLLNPLDVNTPIGNMPTPSSAGPVTAKLNQNAVKLTDFFRTLLEDSIEKLDEPASMLTSLKLQLEQAKWKHQAEIKEIKHNHELTLAEMRALFEKEKARAVAEARRAAMGELEAAVKAAKAKQWCANCSQEAQFYCCWNTSYCDYPCQRAHWAQHFSVCLQPRQDGSNSNEPPAPAENRLQPQPDSLPKSSAAPAPALTVGGKIAPRAFSHDSPSAAQKNAIIVSMVEDQSGNQTMKCVGTYKAPPGQNMSPIILNKQIMNSEENSNKKVVSSGGYLIVGGGANNSAVVTPARRTHTIQYFT